MKEGAIFLGFGIGAKDSAFNYYQEYEVCGTRPNSLGTVVTPTGAA